MQHQEQTLLAAILNAAVDAIIVIDELGTIQAVNPSTTRLFGYAADEMLGKNVKMLMPAPYREEHDGYLANYLETGHAKIIGIGREVTGNRKDGTTFPMHLAVSEVTVDERRLFAGIVRDISDLKHAQQQLTEVNEQLEQRVRERTAELHSTQAELLRAEKLATLGQVSGGIAHEIRNPLNAVRTSAYFLRHAKNPSGEKTAEHLERIERQVMLIDNVITALADVARLPEPNVELCNIHELIRDVMGSVSMPDHIQIQNDVPVDLPPPLIDPNQIAIVFRNLLRNARDAMPDGGTIRLVSKSRDDVIVVAVIDTGTGIEERNLRRVTEPLFSTKTRGLGLGLAISEAIIDKNYGRLEVTSKFGVGTTVAVHLPLRSRSQLVDSRPR